MKNIGWFILFIFSQSAYGQQNSTEHIANNRKQLSSENDTVLFTAYIELATHFNFIDGQEDSVLHFAQKALKIADKYDIPIWKIRANYYHGIYHYNYSQDFEKAIFYYELVKTALIEQKDSSRLPTLYNAIGACKAAQGDLEGAMSDYMEVYTIAKDKHHYTNLTNTLSNTSVLYSQMGREDKAIAMLKEAIEHNKKDTSLDSGYSFLNASLNLLDGFVRLDSIDEALVLIPKIEKVADSLQYAIATDRLINQKIIVLQKTNQIDELDKLLSEAYQNIKESKTHNQNFQTIASGYAENEIRKGNISKARQVIAEIKNQTDQTSVVYQMEKYESLYELSEGVGEFKQALKYSKQFHNLKDSLNNVEKVGKVEELMKKYDLAKKEAQIQQNELDKLTLERKNSLLLAILMGLIGLASLTYIVYYNRRRKEQEKIRQLEQKMLSLQMNPHFIFNAISSIQNYLYDAGDAEKAIHHLSTFASLMRQILENSREKFIPLEEEIEFLNNYLNLQKLRFDDKFDFEIQIDPDIDVEHISIPPLLTQPFVENAIEHGKIYTVPEGKLILKISKNGKNLCIDIIDNGVGIDNRSDPEKGLDIEKKSLSISITKERLELLSKLMKNSFSLKIQANVGSNGTHVQLNIPSIYL